MARKYDTISALAERTAKEVVKNEETWKTYLNTAARIYKYPFQEQMLIYAQRPDATACASIEIWNGKMNCWVNKGAKGIALIDEDAPVPRLKYVFDVKDVHKARRIGRDPYLWEFKPEQEEAVLNRLERIYGETDQEKMFAGRLLEIAERISEDCYQEIASDLSYLTEGSFLEGLDEYSMEVHLRETLKASISYTLLTRCGVDVETYGDSLNFEFIHEFNTVPVLAQLGNSVTELSKPILMEIGKAVRAYERTISEKAVDNSQDLRYNALKRESEMKEQETGKEINSEEKEERGSEDGIDISEERRLLHPEYQDGRTAGGNPDEVRASAEEIPEGEQGRPLLRTAFEGQADGTPAGDPGNSRAENGASDQADGRGAGRGREPERAEPHGLGTADEQHPADSRGDHPDGTDLSLGQPQIHTEPEKSDSDELPDFLSSVEENTYSMPEEAEVQGEPVYEQMNLFPTMAEQAGNIAIDHADDWLMPPAENPITKEMIEYALLTGGGQKDSRPRIFAKYQKGLDDKTMEEFLKKEYGMGGKGFTFQGQPFCIWYDKSGMNFAKGNAARFQPALKLDWAEVEETTHQLICSGRYMEEAEIWHVPTLERMELASKIYFFFRDEYGTMPEELKFHRGSVPECEEALAEMLSTTEGIDKILGHMDQAIDKLDRGEARPRIRLIYRPKDIRTSVEELKRIQVKFPPAEKLDIPKETFITQDEIDHRLGRGSGVSEGLLRIY